MTFLKKSLTHARRTHLQMPTYAARFSLQGVFEFGEADARIAFFFLILQRLCTRAEFQFQKGTLETDEGSTSAPSEFNLKAWMADLGQSKLSQQMYFL